MKRLLTLFATLISLTVNAQVSDLRDTIPAVTTPTYTPNFVQNTYTSGGVNYRLIYSRNPSINKWDFNVTGKYLKAFYNAKSDSLNLINQIFSTARSTYGDWNFHGTTNFQSTYTNGEAHFIQPSGYINFETPSDASQNWAIGVDGRQGFVFHKTASNTDNRTFQYDKTTDRLHFSYSTPSVTDNTLAYTSDLSSYRKKTDTITYGDKARAIRIIFKGSSITRGVGQDGVVEYDSTFVNKVSRLMGVKTVNFGYSGRAIQCCVNTPDSSFYATRSNVPNYSDGDYLVLECQVNDVIDSAHYNIGTYAVQIDSVVLKAMTLRGWPANHIILANYAYYNPPASSSYPNVEHRHDEYVTLMQNEATLRGTLFYDDYYTFKTKYIANPALLDAAVLHPTPAGYTVAANDFDTWFSTYVTPINLTPINSQIIGSGSVYGDFKVSQDVSINNDLTVGNKIKTTAIAVTGLPTLMDDSGTVFTPLGGQQSGTTASQGYGLFQMDGTNNRRFGPFISSTAVGLTQLYSTSALPFWLGAAGVKWFGASSSGVTLPIISAYGSTATNFLTSVSGLVESRTPAQVLADILAAPLASPNFTGTVNTPALTVTATAGTDVTPLLVTNSNASGGSAIQINRTNTVRTASVQFSTSGTVAWATGMLRNGGSANTSYFIGQNADANISTPVLSLTTGAKVGVNVISPTSFLDLPAAVTGTASLRIRDAGLDPTTNNGGDIWVNGGLLKYYDGTNSAIRTVANLGQAQTLTNKTLTAPILTGLTTATNTSEAFRMAYDGSNYMSFTPNSTGGGVFSATGTSPYLTFNGVTTHFTVPNFDITMPNASTIGPVINAGDATHVNTTWQNYAGVTAAQLFGDGHILFNSYVQTTTQTAGDNSTKAATTAFVQAALTNKTLYTNSAFATVTNTTTETSLIPTGVGSLTLPIGVAGKEFRAVMGGVYSAPLTPGTLTVNIYYGSTVIATGTITGLVNGSNLSFNGNLKITTLTVGASGTVTIDGAINYSVGNNLARLTLDLNNTGNSVTVANNATQTFDVKVQWDTASSSKIIKATQFSLESLN